VVFVKIIPILCVERDNMDKKYNILAVDDDNSLLKLLSKELIDEGYLVTMASNGEKAIAQLQKNKFDLILLDIKMPKMSGFEVLKFIKTNTPSTKVIMLTAYADVHHALESKRLGAEDFMEKPYDLGELLSSIERQLVG